MFILLLEKKPGSKHYQKKFTKNISKFIYKSKIIEELVLLFFLSRPDKFRWSDSPPKLINSKV